MAFGSAGEVKEEIDFLMKTYGREDGRLMMTMGNGSTPDWKIQNLNALYEASLYPAGKRVSSDESIRNVNGGDSGV